MPPPAFFPYSGRSRNLTLKTSYYAMKHFDFEDILKSACHDKMERQLLLMFLFHNPSFLENPFGSNFFKGLKVTLDLAPLKALAPIRFPSDWTDPDEKDLFLYLLFSSAFPFSMEWDRLISHLLCMFLTVK